MGAKRIGHGVAIVENEEIKELCRKYKVCLEMCPVSNLQTGAVEDIFQYPFWRLYKEGVCATIHTDNRTVSNTSLTNEWAVLTEKGAACLPEGEKKKLEEIILKYKLQNPSVQVL